MALLLNICKYNGCGIVFSALNDLIEHVETHHIDFDPHLVDVLESERPAHIPLSYALPFNMSVESFQQDLCSSPNENSVALQHHNYSICSLGQFVSENETDRCSELTTNSDWKSEDIGSDEEFTMEFIMRYGKKQSGNEFDEKPFACPVPGCKKRYKNVNGIRYHAKNGHKKKCKKGKNFECHCGKSYKTAQGLKNHVTAMHNTAEVILPSTSSFPQPMDMLSLTKLASLPSNFEGFYDNENANTNDNNNNNNNIYHMSSEQECKGNTKFYNSIVRIEGTESSRSSGDTFEVSKSTGPKQLVSHVKVYNEENVDDIIDVGDAADCVYPYYS